ncbi:undecaprenyl-diphosphate phosphatase [Roseibium denhamense]|uniref:Undecaprenyl-diphosphatase n=1 Tax=Roseibium denhamense TaxID=76305 RepID=A0ABY1PIY8_9HYPH|nr:undecaprenyl-diphosphate phosphatase [Roseibium denhamense]MTI05532.1 undecaprenyl-diphosphate phosphatase [Roseibium denhamense]SMP35145.1 Undecaprenyl-diphosphatase [Roseibium denhamense]
MDGQTIVNALILGVVEGLTEFIPVSSTGHILLLGHFLGFDSTGKTFEVLIQLGAILAILSVYSARLWALATSLPSDPASRRFVFGILIAFLPAAVIGVMAHGFIKEVLFETPALICTTLLVGGIILLWIDRLPLTPKYTNVMDYPVSLCLKIGFCQCLAMVPGVSRSGATIAGSLLMGTDKRSAAEFSFFLAMPTMAGAFAYDLFKNRNVLSTDDIMIISIGFVASFVAAIFVVKGLLNFVSRHGFAPFAWWRIFVGLAGFAGLYFFG